MISIIICSREKDIPQSLKENIAQTIGTSYELVVVDNSDNKYNIFTAYNEGVARSKGDFLVFAHDDVVKYHTQGWGENIERHFSDDKDLGLIGVAGSHFMPNFPAEWYCCHTASGGCIQTVGGKTENMQYLQNFKDGQTLLNAVMVDGMWMCIRRSLFHTIRFDDQNFEGWHCYDTDICLQVINAGNKVGIASDVLVEHTSFGTWNRQWVKATKQVYEKWKHLLPIVRGMEMTEQEIKWRTDYIETEMEFAFSNVQLQSELKNVRQSNAYRFGKMVTRPLAKIKNKIVGGGDYQIVTDILLITYNQERYIEDALRGISIQILDEDIKVRIIVADDCSTDRTFEIIKQYENKLNVEFLYLPREKNLGIAENYKRAIRATNGDFVAILEGDDYWTDKYRLQKHIDYLSSNIGCVMTANSYFEYSEKNKEWKLTGSKERYLFLRTMIYNYQLANLSARVYRGVILRQVEDKTFVYGEKQRREATDYYITMDVLQHGYGYVISDVMSVYRVNTGNNLSKREMSLEEEIERGRLCMEQMLDMLGFDYKNECQKVYANAIDLVKSEKKSKRIQQWSDYASPAVANIIWKYIPKSIYAIKHFMRQCIPNKIHNKLK